MMGQFNKAKRIPFHFNFRKMIDIKISQQILIQYIKIAGIPLFPSSSHCTKDQTMYKESFNIAQASENNHNARITFENVPRFVLSLRFRSCTAFIPSNESPTRKRYFAKKQPMPVRAPIAVAPKKIRK